MRVYAASDIHGFLEPLEIALEKIDLEDENSTLVLLGDYVDRGPDSLGVLKTVMGLQERYGERVVALRGNHEEMLLEYVREAGDPGFCRAWMLTDSNLATAKSFLSADQFESLRRLLVLKRFEDAYRYTVECMEEAHGDIIEWIRKLPYYWESPFNQVFVHAGIDEDAGPAWWKLGTPKECFTTMLPDFVGKHFGLTVVAGHVDVEDVSGIPGYRGIWFDRKSHYFIDANVVRHGEVAVLTYDSETGKYSGPGLDWG